MRVLVTDALHPFLVERLQGMGYTCDVEPDIQQEAVLQRIADYAGLVVATKIKVREPLLKAATQLRWVGRAGSGMENIDRNAAALRNVACLSAPEGNAEAVAEHALGMLLALFNKLRSGDREFRLGQFRREAHRGLELGGRTVGIVGYGHTGRAFARRLAGMGVQVLAYDKYQTGHGGPLAKAASLEQIHDQADVLSLHLPLNEETRYWLNADRIRQFAKPFHLINTSRGPVVESWALVEALDEGRILGACLDVFEEEKPHAWSANATRWWEALRHRDNTLFSPHVAGWTVESKKRIAAVLADRIEALGQHPMG